MKKTTKDYQNKTQESLKQDIIKLREEIAKDRLSFKISLPKNTNSLSHKKKKLAVLLTLLNQKQ